MNDDTNIGTIYDRVGSYVKYLPKWLPNVLNLSVEIYGSYSTWEGTAMNFIVPSISRILIEAISVNSPSNEESLFILNNSGV